MARPPSLVAILSLLVFAAATTHGDDPGSATADQKPVNAPEGDSATRPPAGSSATGERFIRVFISRSDKNGDGVVEKSEFRGSAARFDELDANTNGKLEPEELLPLFRSRLNDSKSMEERLKEGTAPPPGARKRPPMGQEPQAFATTPDGRKVSGEFIFKRLDVDGDGNLTVEDFGKSPGMGDPAETAEVVARIDQDKDGRLSWTEFDRVFRMRHGKGKGVGPAGTEMESGGYSHPFLIAMGAKGGAGASPEQLTGYQRIFERLDADGDGILTTVEFVEAGTYLTPQARAGIFRASDSNGDGNVSEAEYVENRIITDEAKAIVGRADFDRDGKITRAEFLRHPALTDEAKATTATEIWRGLDTSGDGEITPPEYLRVWGRWARAGDAKAAASDGKAETADAGPNAVHPGFAGPPGGGFPGGGKGKGGLPDPAVLLERFDRNEDGKLAKEEVPEFLWSRLAPADADSDGVVTRTELASRKKRP